MQHLLSAFLRPAGARWLALAAGLAAAGAAQAQQLGAATVKVAADTSRARVPATGLAAPAPPVAPAPIGPAPAPAPRALGPVATSAPRAPAPPHVPRLGVSIVIDNRDSFVQESAVRIVGLNVGVVPRGKPYRLGLGAYTLRRNYSDLYTYVGRGKNRRLKDTLTPALDLTYFTPNFSYTFFNRRFVEFSIPVDVGLGRSHYTITDENGKVTTDDRGLFVPAEIGLGVLLKPTRWVGVSGGAGYRKSLKEIDYKEDFDGWYFSYRLNFFVGNIWHDCRQYHQRRQARRAARQPLAAPVNP